MLLACREWAGSWGAGPRVILALITMAEDAPPFVAFVKSRDILYILSLDILYMGGEELGLGTQRSMIFERWVPGSSSRMRVVQ